MAQLKNVFIEPRLDTDIAIQVKTKDDNIAIQQWLNKDGFVVAEIKNGSLSTVSVTSDFLTAKSLEIKSIDENIWFSVDLDGYIMVKADMQIGVNSSSTLYLNSKISGDIIPKNPLVSLGGNGQKFNNLYVTNIYTNTLTIEDNPLVVKRSSLGLDALNIRVTSETHTRFKLLSDGEMRWGSGFEDEDILLKRITEGTLFLGGSLTVIGSLDVGVSLNVEGALIASSLKTTTGEIEVMGNGKGVVMKTPDGTKTYRVRIDNNGNIFTEQV